MKRKKPITHEDLIHYLDYCSESGVFKWKNKKSINTSIGDIAGQLVKSRSGKSYIRISFNYRQYLAHQLAWFYVNGVFPHLTIDHIDGNGLNNKISNLSQKTMQENSKNMRLNKRNKLGILGVYYYESSKSYKAEIKHNGKLIRLLYSKDFFEVCCARKSAERRFGFHENHGSIRPL